MLDSGRADLHFELDKVNLGVVRIARGLEFVVNLPRYNDAMHPRVFFGACVCALTLFAVSAAGLYVTGKQRQRRLEQEILALEQVATAHMREQTATLLKNRESVSTAAA